MATRRDVIHRIQKIANNPAEDLQGLNKQVKMLAKVMLALEKHYGKREKTLDQVAKKVHELVGAVNSLTGPDSTGTCIPCIFGERR